MSLNHQEIPKPTPVSSLPIPEIPEHLKPKPSPLGITTCTITGRMELAIILKVTYTFKHARIPKRADKQLPLALENEEHDELAPEVKGSVKAVPELVGFNTGTDVVVRAHARSRQPQPAVQVSISVEKHRHAADVYGRRIVEVTNGAVSFSQPEMFEAMPLRYELAYGGVDKAFEKSVVDFVKPRLDAERIRRIAPIAEDFLQGIPPVAYPRNHCGKGYVLVADPKQLAGLELPNIELPDDHLTPDRLVPVNPLRWPGQPVPAGFDYMDPTMFPRSAMAGLPPMAEWKWEEYPEVRRGQVPPDFCRGNILHAEREEIPGLIHPELARCAPIGLRLPFLRGKEAVILKGMDLENQELLLELPGEQPVFRLPAAGKEVELVPQLFQLFIDVDQKYISLIWGARIPWKRALLPGEDKEILATVKVHEVKL